MLKILLPLAIIEEILLDYNFHFRVIFREFMQTYKDIRNDTIQRYVNTMALEPNGNLYDRIHCFSHYR